MENLNTNYHPYFVTGFCGTLFNRNFIRKYSSHNTSLIIWGTNLQSTVGEKFSRQELSMVKFSPYHRDVIVGLILSDAWLSKDRKNARLGFKQSLAHSAYVLFVFSILSHYCNSNPHLVIANRIGKKSYGLEFFTRAMPCLTELRTLFYSKVKIIPENIYDLLTPPALAHLIMGDGNAERSGLIICTNSFTLQEVIKLMNVLLIKYGLNSNIREKKQINKTEYMIYIKQNSMPLLRSIVNPYMHSSMLYKINNKAKYSTLTKNYFNINSTSFNESCFHFDIKESSRYKTGWSVIPKFYISLHKRDMELLKSIQYSLGEVGSVSVRDKNAIHLQMSSKKDILKIIEHFEKYPLISQKWSDYFLFKEMFSMFYNLEHLNIDGIEKLITFKASLNKGLPDKLKKIFPSIIAEPRPLLVNQVINDPNWISGFTSGEGCFFVNLRDSKTHKLGKQVVLFFYINLHIRDKEILEKIKEYLNCGNCYDGENKTKFTVEKFSDIYEKVIPFFKKYPVHGIKAQDFKDFCNVAELVKTGKHLTQEGLNEIQIIKNTMNRGRDNEILSDIEKIEITKSDSSMLFFLIVIPFMLSFPMVLITFVLIIPFILKFFSSLIKFCEDSHYYVI